MKEYPSIKGWALTKHSLIDLPCIAFYKYDGSNIRAEWSKKRGWYKFGTRHRIFDENDPLFGPAISVFLNTFGDDIPKVIKDNKNYKKADRVIAYCEYFGPNSIGMWHDWKELHSIGELVLFDINIHQRGLVLPRQFVDDFGHLKIAEVVYEGNFDKNLVRDVWDGKLKVKEGIVAKGVEQRKRGRPEHGLWMTKCKTAWWFDEIKRRCEETDNEEYRRQWKQLIEENELEQGACA